MALSDLEIKYIALLFELERIRYLLEKEKTETK